MTAPIVFDISRLIYDAGRQTPTGVLRVELAYAQYLLATHPERLLFTARDALGRMVLVSRWQAMRLVAETAALWAGKSELKLPVLALRCFFVWIHFTLLLRAEWRLRAKLRRAVKPAVYILVSHANLDRPAAIRRLKTKAGARLVFFFHDLIPLQFPEFETPGWDKRCELRLQTAAELADAILVNSRHTAEELGREVGTGHRLPQIVVVPLGVMMPEEAITPPVTNSNRPYFVVIGTIEPKKNHLLLLNIWRQLRHNMGDAAPRLIVIGRRGWENENVIDMLERSRGFPGFVEERGTVSDHELKSLLAGARALLLPSFTEGYGLPLAEALAAGRPVICSDIPAFREVGGDVPDFLDPLDGPSWRQAILDYMPEASPRRQAQLARMTQWVAPSWDGHFREVAKLLETLGA